MTIGSRRGSSSWKPKSPTEPPRRRDRQGTLVIVLEVLGGRGVLAVYFGTRFFSPGRSAPLVHRAPLRLPALAELGRRRLLERLPLLDPGVPAGDLRRPRAPVVRIAEIGV